jgi:O-antigen/teichoic acid export membrane protein
MQDDNKVAFRQSIRFRFLVSVVSNVARAALGFATTLIIARLLGVQNYGNFVFLAGFFIAYRSISELGTSSAFYYFITQKSRGRKFIWTYIAWQGIQCILPLIVIGLLLPVAWASKIWVGLPKSLVLLAFLAIFFRDQVWQTVISLFESKRLSYLVQPLSAVISLGNLLLVLALWWLNYLNLTTLFVLIIAEYLVYIFLAYLLFEAMHKKQKVDDDFSIKKTVFEYVEYCLPLVLYAVVLFFYGIVDRWLLQHYSGAASQAYYGVGAYFSSGCLIATTAIVSVFMKEISEAYYQKNLVKVKNLYFKVLVLLFMITAACIGFLIPWSKEIIVLILGPAYAGGVVVFAIMLLLPVHQAMDKICKSVFYATGDTKEIVTILLIFQVISIPVTYFLLASTTAIIPGLHLGAVGLSLKMVALNILMVNAMILFLAKKYHWKFLWRFQLFGLLFVLLLGAGAKFVFYPLHLGWQVHMAFSFVIYFSILFFITNKKPEIVGLTKDEIRWFFNYVTGFIRKDKKK